MRILHNIPALQSYNALTKTNDQLAAAINRLSTGLRINSAADDAAGLAISEKMRSQIKGLDQASSNAQDGISMIQTAEGALGEVHSMLQRMRELAVQAANDTLTQEDRSYIQIEVDQLKEEINRISTTTQFNRKQLLDGSAGCIWSTDNLDTKVIVNGGLRTIDQFGQKSAAEGNFRITIDALPGQAQIQKSDLFKIKHPNVIMNVTMNTGAGVQSVRVDSMPAGDYVVTSAGANVLSGYANAAFFQKRLEINPDASASAQDVAAEMFDITWSDLGISENQSILMEVTNVNTAANSESVAFRVQIKGLSTDAAASTHSESNFLIGAAGNTGPYTNLGWNATNGAFKINVANIGKFSVGDKVVFNYVPDNTIILDPDKNPDRVIKVNGKLNDDWDEKWVHYTDAAGKVPTPATTEVKFNVKAGLIQNTDIHMQNFYLNEQNGTTYEGDVVLTLNDSFRDDTEATLTTFQAAYIGQVAKGDVALRDLDKFWDANGKFLLDNAQTLTMIQGDGTKASFTIYGTDTLEEVRKKMNDTIADGLGQAKYSPESRNNFVTFVDKTNVRPNTDVSVESTFVIRSIIPGNDGLLSFSGDENIIRAFSLNTIQESRESQFRVSVYDAHTGATVASSVKISGNRLYGVVAPNIDVRFDPMADIEAKWNTNTSRFDLVSKPEVYSTIVHLTDNSTVFQIGANESEDMAVDIGDMSSEALGITNINVSDRAAAAKALGKIDTAIGLVSKQRAKLGAYQNRLEYTVSNLTTASSNTSEAESRIRDADMAKEMMEFTKLNILSQSGSAMLAQANQLPNNILSLLQR